MNKTILENWRSPRTAIVYNKLNEYRRQKKQDLLKRMKNKDKIYKRREENRLKNKDTQK